MKNDPRNIQPFNPDLESPFAFYQHCFDQGKKIKPDELEDLGYRLTARYLVINAEIKLYELLPINSSKAAKHCFLSPDPRLIGVMVSNTFHEHKALLQSASDKLRLASVSNLKRNSGIGLPKLTVDNNEKVNLFQKI
jgi:hypothetical protein